MRSTILVAAAALGLAVAAPTPATAQGKPDRPPPQAQKDKEKDRATPPGQSAARGQGQGQARGQAKARGRRGGPAPDVAAFNRNAVGRAAAARGRRNADGRRVAVQRQGDEIRVVREDGQVLFALDREKAERIGYWRVAVAPEPTERRRDRAQRGTIFDRVGGDGDRDTGGEPAFCRSGEGHPVWGREWCIDKGFGLGNDSGLWGRATDIEDVVLRRPRTDRDELDRESLADILGDIVFGRIALQSLVLGADEPLTGRWIGEPDGPRVLRIRAGDITVAELVDGNRDDRVDVLLFNLGD